jgi:hypothetical protein
LIETNPARKHGGFLFHCKKTLGVFLYKLEISYKEQCIRHVHAYLLP